MLLPRADLAAAQVIMNVECGARATQSVRYPLRYLIPGFPIHPLACLVFSGELKDFDVLANNRSPFKTKGLRKSAGMRQVVSPVEGSRPYEYH